MSREIPAEVLLGRPQRSGSLAEASAWVRGKRVLVTGAAGSVGTPLSRTLLAAEPASLVLLDHHEYSLFNLERSLGPARDGLSYQLVDLANERRLAAAFERLQPEVIFHLAAAKHVPYGERFPDNVLETNVFGTQRLLDLAEGAGRGTFIYPSSDKSVAPPSVYGASKRLCEALVQSRAAGRGWVIGRYVNIIGTRGSVIETFAGQVQAGKSLSVTDERMTRYWISMDEAIWLLLQAGQRGEPGEVLMPDCGDAIPVLETARRLASWLCSERDPYPINLTGIRPGERLHEVLLSVNERLETGPASGVCRVESRRDPGRLQQLPDVLAELRALVDAGDTAGVHALAMSAASDLQ